MLRLHLLKSGSFHRNVIKAWDQIVDRIAAERVRFGGSLTLGTGHGYIRARNEGSTRIGNGPREATRHSGALLGEGARYCQARKDDERWKKSRKQAHATPPKLS